MRRARRTRGYVWASLVSLAVVATATPRSNSSEVPASPAARPGSAALPARKSLTARPSGIRPVAVQSADLPDVNPAAVRRTNLQSLEQLFAQDAGPPPLPPAPATEEAGPGSPNPRANPLQFVPVRTPVAPVEIGGNERLKLVEFREVPLVDAMQTFAEQAGINVVTSPDAGKVTISVYLRNVTAKQALDAITKANGLFYKADDQSGIVRVLTTKEYRQTLADFQDERTEVFTLLYPNPYVVALAIRNTFGSRVQLGFGDQISDQDQISDLNQRLQRFNLLNSQNQGLGSFQGGQNGQNNGQNGFNQGGFGNQFGGGFGNQFGGGFGNQFGGGFGGAGGFGGQMFGLNQNGQQGSDSDRQPLEDLTPEEIFAIEQVRQGNAESNDLSGLLERSRATIYVTVIRRNNQLIVRTGDEQIMKQIQELVQRLDVPTPLVLLEVKVLRVELTDGFHSVFDYQLTDGADNAGTFSQGDLLPIPGKDAANIAIAGSTFGLGGTPGLAASAGDLTFQYVNEAFRLRMQLLENKNRVTVVTAPILLTANNEVSRIFVGDSVPITTTSASANVQQATAGNPTVTANSPTTVLQDIGQALLIAPSINADRTVTLRIAQEQSEIRRNGGQIFVPVTTTTPLGGANSVTFERQSVDTVQRRSVTGTVVAKDGLAVAIGGLISEGVEDNRDEVPVLGKVPVLGFFFRRQSTGRARSELIIMVRPYVFNTPSESAAMSQQLLPELSIHPGVPDGNGTLNTFLPHEVVRPRPPLNETENIFRFHSVEPRSY